MSAPIAVVADDEELLAQVLIAELENAWPELAIAGTAENGPEAIETIFRLQPDVVFLDIQMPGATGIAVAETIAEEWPDADGSKPPPLIVFVTAYNDYAIQAFDSAALDYLLKPVKLPRLQQTVERLQRRLARRSAASIEELSRQIHSLLDSDVGDATPKSPGLRVIRASAGDVVQMIPVEEVIFFESADKYVSVHTATGEALIREPLRKLLPQLDAGEFAQIHRGTIVNLSCVDSAVRDDTGKVHLRLKGHSKELVVSRIYRHLFQAM